MIRSAFWHVVARNRRNAIRLDDETLTRVEALAEEAANRFPLGGLAFTSG